MRCERCGVELTNKIIKINDVPYCENCARIMGYGKFLRSPEEMLGSAFSPFDEIASSIMQMNELDFGNSALSCPKCGRMPAQPAELNGEEKEQSVSAKKEALAEKAPANEEAAEAGKPEETAAEESDDLKALALERLSKLEKADLGTLSDEDLQTAIKLAADNEDYILASKLRDELKGRKEGN